jgi:ABC-type oligopeptide transport system substrate-binding subunit
MSGVSTQCPSSQKKSGSGGDFNCANRGQYAMAADVPAGVQLAEKQTLVRNNGAEVQSLDPHKIEGVPESNINRDLFEGLLVTDVDGHPARAWLKAGKIKILKSGPSICVKMRNGPTARRLPPRFRL